MVKNDIEIEAGEPDIEPGTVFEPMQEHDTMEIAIPPDAFDCGIGVTLYALEQELQSRWFAEPAIAAIIEGVRRRVAG